MATKKVLLRKTVTKTVPSYRWVVEDLCGNCREKIKAAAPAVEPDEDLPEPPVVDAEIIPPQRIRLVSQPH
jgi:hypothetical protein